MRAVISVRNDGKVNLTTVYSVIIALLPVIMIYNVPIVNKGLSTILVGLTAPIALYYTFTSFKMCPPVWFVCIFFFYCMYRSWGDFESVFLLFMVLIHVLGAFGGSLDFRVMRKTIETVAVFCTYLVIIQYVVYFVFGIRFSFLITNLIINDNQNAVNSFIDGVGMFRPSALFLEPSHLAQYCNLAILSVLFPEGDKKPNLRKAIWIAAGIILTTSGMGIVLCGCLLLWYAVFSRRKQGIQSILRVLFWAVIIIVAYVLLMRLSFFNSAVGRIFGDHGAIWGRTLFWDSYIGSLKGFDLIFGKGVNNLPDGYMTGLMEVVYCFGIVGAVLLAIAFMSIATFSKNNVTICACIIFLGLQCIANLFGFIPLIFWFCFTVSSFFKRVNND